MKGQVVKVISNLFTVKVNDELYGCRARGKFRKDNIVPVVGDNVVIDIDDNIILDILPRRNILKRPVIANVNMAIIVVSTKHPNLDLNLLDKLISLVTYNGIEPVICLTKLDLLKENELNVVNNVRKYYEMIGIKVFDNTEVTSIKRVIKDKVVVLAGQTGAGKSSLINKLDQGLNVKTDEISKALGRGKHTTRHVELYEIGEGLIADTPGFSALDLDGITRLELRDTFVEFSKYECRFRDCIHNKEKECGVKKAVSDQEILKSRYNNYLLFLEELEK